MVETVFTAVGVMFALAGLFSVLLVAANVKLAVEVDPRQRAIEQLLPQANCGNCGFASCAAYARAVVAETAAVDRCTVGGPPVAERIAALLGVELTENFPFRPVIHCGAGASDRLQQGNYIGERTCAAAAVVGGVQGCTYGCLGFGDCVEACEYDAMELVDGLPRINYVNCIGCGACVRACPRGIIEQVPFKVEQMMIVACANHDPGKVVRQVCRVGCVGCGACSRLQPELFSIQDNLAEIDYSKYSGDEDLEPVLETCPMESLLIMGKPLPRHEEQLADVDAVTHARKTPPERPTTEDMHWRG